MLLPPRRPLLRVTKADAVTVVRLTDTDLEEGNVHAVAEELSVLAAGRPVPRLELDLAEVRFLSSTALGRFVGLHTRLRAAGGRLVLANVSRLAYELFAVSRLDQVLDVRRASAALAS
jgi:anti-sigma B factor antagonist